MNERDDYLFDPASAPDPDVAALEQALAPLRWKHAPRADDEAPRAPRRRRRPWFVLIAAAAGLALFVLLRKDGGTGDLLRPDAEPRQFVAGKAPLVIPLGELAEITLRPGSELAFVHWRPDQALFALAYGGLEAKVAPPPKVQPEFFAVDTPLGRVIDQGCRFTLELLEHERAVVQVSEGAVMFAGRAQKVFVPAGAAVRVQKGGPGTPCFSDAPEELQKALQEYDFARDSTERDKRTETAKMVFAAARRRADSLVLWHMLSDRELIIRDAAEANLIELVGAPDRGKTKQGTFEPEEWLAFLRLEAWQR